MLSVDAAVRALGWPEVHSVELSALYPGGGGADVPLGAAKRTADGAWAARVRLQRGCALLTAELG